MPYADMLGPEDALPAEPARKYKRPGKGLRVPAKKTAGHMVQGTGARVEKKIGRVNAPANPVNPTTQTPRRAGVNNTHIANPEMLTHSGPAGVEIIDVPMEDLEPGVPTKAGPRQFTVPLQNQQAGSELDDPRELDADVARFVRQGLANLSLSDWNHKA
jgi:hypothetical protein